MCADIDVIMPEHHAHVLGDHQGHGPQVGRTLGGVGSSLRGCAEPGSGAPARGGRPAVWADSYWGRCRQRHMPPRCTYTRTGFKNCFQKHYKGLLGNLPFEHGTWNKLKKPKQGSKAVYRTTLAPAEHNLVPGTRNTLKKNV
jgi:hypothetical protein